MNQLFLDLKTPTQTFEICRKQLIALRSLVDTAAKQAASRDDIAKQIGDATDMHKRAATDLELVKSFRSTNRKVN